MTTVSKVTDRNRCQEVVGTGCDYTGKSSLGLSSTAITRCKRRTGNPVGREAKSNGCATSTDQSDSAVKLNLQTNDCVDLLHLCSFAVLPVSPASVEDFYGT